MKPTKIQNEHFVGNYMASCSLVSCMAHWIFLRGLVRLLLSVRSLHRCNKASHRITHERSSVAIGGRQAHG
ncbi:hypothetical protein AC249_AIPGENE23264 [Exaiptasia diaphana]|nr:hypothetical protein AC249_AIPGENE23264 [Exaiptasia diaphana]